MYKSTFKCQIRNEQWGKRGTRNGDDLFIGIQFYFYHTAQKPPSTGIVIPFSILDLSLNRNTIASATSSGSKILK